MVERCKCEEKFPVKIMFAFSESVICCMNCNLEVGGKKFDELERSSEFKSWKSEYKSIYELWLASGDYEAWAGEELSNPKSKLNRSGLELTRIVGGISKCYYWLHSTETMSFQENSAICPNCEEEMKIFNGRAPMQMYCDHCCIVVTGE